MEILYRDSSVVVCRKPVGVLSQGGEDDLVCRLGAAEGRVWPVHRLDRNVGGVMVFAKSAAAAAKLTAAMGQGRFQKEYLAVLRGSPEEDEAVLRDLLFKDSAKNKSYVVRRMRKGVKEASLEYRVLGRTAAHTLIRVRLHTGRTHQIRVQFASRQLPLVGDGKYGSGDNRCPIALFAARLTFPHPETGEALTFSALPDAAAYPWNEFTLPEA